MRSKSRVHGIFDDRFMMYDEQPLENKPPLLLYHKITPEMGARLAYGGSGKDIDSTEMLAALSADSAWLSELPPGSKAVEARYFTENEAQRRWQCWELPLVVTKKGSRSARLCSAAILVGVDVPVSTALSASWVVAAPFLLLALPWFIHDLP